MPVILTERVLNKELLTRKQRKFKERILIYHKGFPGGSMVKSLPANAGDVVQSLGQEDPLGKEMTPTPIFLPEKSHGQRSLEGYSPCGLEESDTT